MEEDKIDSLSAENLEYADNRLQHMLQKYLTKHYINDPLLKRFRLCGSRLLEQVSPAVFVVKSANKSRLYGIACCHNSWGCPRCTAKRMAENGVAIGAAIDALKTKYHESAFMITLTIPHRRWMNISDTFTILKNSWRAFSKNTGRIAVTHQYTLKTDKAGKKGTVVEYSKHLRNPLANMRYELDIKHSVRAYEFTWSPENGWHPHIHLLYWVPDAKFDKLNDGWEEKLVEFWWDICKKETLKYYNEKYPDQPETNASVTESIFNPRLKYPKTGHRNIYFSKDCTGKVKRSASSEYISGWGGDNELTNDRKEKRASDGHYSPRQILEQAFYNQTEQDRNKWLKLYVEYLKTVYGSKRVHFSTRSGITAIIKEWKQTNAWTEAVKKKVTKKAPEKWKVVCWFDKEQWSQICFENLNSDKPLIVEILKLAIEKKGKEKIATLLQQYDIQLHKHKHHYEQVIENDIYENNALNNVA